MKQFILENKRILIVTALAILAGILIGFSIAISYSENEVQETGASIGKCIAPNADIRAELTFTRCEHRIQIALDPEPYVGLNQKELASRHPGAIISKFEPEKIVFTKHVTGVCGSHYLMELQEDGKIVVRHFDETLLDMKDAVTIGMSASTLEPLLVSELEDGVVFSSMNEVNAYLENAES